MNLCDNIKYTNSHIIGVLEGKKENTDRAPWHQSQQDYLDLSPKAKETEAKINLMGVN